MQLHSNVFWLQNLSERNKKFSFELLFACIFIIFKSKIIKKNFFVSFRLFLPSEKSFRKNVSLKVFQTIERNTENCFDNPKEEKVNAHKFVDFYQIYKHFIVPPPYRSGNIYFKFFFVYVCQYSIGKIFIFSLKFFIQPTYIPNPSI